MSDQELERLRAAFQAVDDEVAETGDCPPADRIWAAAAGELPPDETGRVIDHLAAHPQCAEAWRLAREIQQSAPVPAAIDTAVAAGPGPRRRWLAAAAVIVTLLAAGLIFRSTGFLRPPAGEVTRQGAGSAIDSLVPEDRPLSRERFLLRWTFGPAGALYRVRVMTAQAELVAESPELEASEYLVPRAALEGRAPGSRIFWQVEARLPDGSSRLSPTFIVEVE